MDIMTRSLINMVDQIIEAEKQPIEVKKTRDGWAGYQAGRRITKFFFSEQGARSAADDVQAQPGWAQKPVITQVVDF